MGRVSTQAVDHLPKARTMIWAGQSQIGKGRQGGGLWHWPEYSRSSGTEGFRRAHKTEASYWLCEPLANPGPGLLLPC